VSPSPPEDPDRSPGDVTLRHGEPDDEATDARRTRRVDVGERRTEDGLPSRYQLREDDTGRYLTCSEAPNVALRLERGRSVSSSAAHRAASHTIFLDGVAQAAPFLDVQRRVYNLDHHEGCVRAFTLATCEQAMVMVMKGLDLGGAQWNLIGNEPDLDTVLAAWLLLNHRRLNGDAPEVRDRIMPMVRLQGIIDAHGLELAALSGFPAELQRATLAEIDRLRADELALKKSGEWSDADPLEFTCRTLERIDSLYYEPHHFEGVTEVEELARVTIAPDRIAVACRAEAGIYEVERQLRSIHGSRVGVILLEKDDATFTLRQTDPFLPTDLEAVYERLNQVDPAAGDGDRWGGSTDIGGSPRRRGTGLSRRQVLDVVGWTFRPPSPWSKLATLAGGLATAVVVLSTITLGAIGTWPPPAEGWTDGAAIAGLGRLALAVVAVAAGALGFAGRRHPGRFGLRRPVGLLWLAALPAVVVAGAAGGVAAELPGPPERWTAAAVAFALAGGLELLLRGVLHGVVAGRFAIMRDGGDWFLSWPTVTAAVTHGFLAVLLFGPPPWLGEGVAPRAAVAAAGFVAGIVLGGARERSRSVWVVAAVHAIAAALLTLLAPVLTAL